MYSNFMHTLLTIGCSWQPQSLSDVATTNVCKVDTSNRNHIERSRWMKWLITGLRQKKYNLNTLRKSPIVQTGWHNQLDLSSYWLVVLTRIRTTPQEDNSPPYRFWSWWVVLFRGSGPSEELSWWGIVLGIVVPVGNGWALFLSGGELSSWGVVLEPSHHQELIPSASAARYSKKFIILTSIESLYASVWCVCVLKP